MSFLVFSFFSFFFCGLDLLYFFFASFVSFLILFSYSSGLIFSGAFFFDAFSFILLFLSVLIFSCCVLSGVCDLWSSASFRSMFLFFGFIFVLLFFSFSCFSALLFYIFFEFVFIFLFFFLLGWGYSPERFQASFYMIFYTIVVSLPFFGVLIYLSSFCGMKFLTWGDLPFSSGVIFFLIFLVKLPVYGVHLWLPKAHVEAPVYGSMVLAGVLLKLGGYGILRFSLVLAKCLFFFKGVLLSVGICGGLVSCALCLRQSDAKAFVAYSSVCHMGLGLGGLVSGTSWGLWGGVFMLVAHGFVSSCLFFVLNVFYQRANSRSLSVLKGFIYFSPLVVFFWFVLLVLNMGVPPFLSFFSEVFIITSLSSVSLSTLLVSFGILFLGGVYNVFLFVSCSHGVGYWEGGTFLLELREFLVFFFHGLFLILSIFFVGIFT